MAVAEGEPTDGPNEPILNNMIVEEYKNFPAWREKFLRWKTLQKACPAASGPTGVYCLYGGHNCSYVLCIFRIFEEEAIIPEKVPLPPVPQKITTRLDAMQKQIDTLLKPQEIQKTAEGSSPQSP